LITQDLAKVAKYASLWATRDVQRIKERDILDINGDEYPDGDQSQATVVTHSIQ